MKFFKDGNNLGIIYKYPINFPGYTTIKGHFIQILDAQIQNNKLVVWAIVDNDEPEIEITFIVLGTGWNIPLDEYWQYFRTVQTDNGDYIWHIFIVDCQSVEVKKKDTFIINNAANNKNNNYIDFLGNLWEDDFYENS